jgi:cyclohexa-1,5-dienecarbonyl-CoA hydratase
MTYRSIRVKSEARAAWITLDRPPLNILDIPMMRELSEAVSEFGPRHDVLVFAGAGERGFSAGAEVRDHTRERAGEMLAAFHEIFRRLARSDCTTIAAIHGHCLGAGNELATFCDFAIAAESAMFGQPEVKLGCFPPVAMVILPRLIGVRMALDLILTGRTISAAQAHSLGLVTRVVPDHDLHHASVELVAQLSAFSSRVIRTTRNALRRASGFDFDAALREMEEIYLEQLMKTEDAAEGVRAFLEKRVPVWQGR